MLCCLSVVLSDTASLFRNAEHQVCTQNSSRKHRPNGVSAQTCFEQICGSQASADIERELLPVGRYLLQRLHGALGPCVTTRSDEHCEEKRQHEMLPHESLVVVEHERATRLKDHQDEQPLPPRPDFQRHPCVEVVGARLALGVELPGPAGSGVSALCAK